MRARVVGRRILCTNYHNSGEKTHLLSSAHDQRWLARARARSRSCVNHFIDSPSSSSSEEINACFVGRARAPSIHARASNYVHSRTGLTSVRVCACILVQVRTKFVNDCLCKHWHWPNKLHCSSCVYSAGCVFVGYGSVCLCVF